MAIILKANKVNLFVSYVLFVFRYHSPNFLDTPRILGRRVHAVKINTETLVAASKEIRLVVNADKVKYMVISRNQNAGRNHNIKNEIPFLEKRGMFSNIWEQPYQSKFYSGRNYEQIEVRECLLSFGAESSVFQCAIQKFKN
jgi:hypothetical protein